MGTRGLTVVVLNKKIVVAQYGQWDHYPSGVGSTIMNFITKKMDLRKFKKALSQCKFVAPEALTHKFTECGFSKEGWGTMEAGDNLKAKYPELSRDTGGEILALIQKKGGLELNDSRDFAADSLFCEYAYVVDLDNKVLEVYKGFNTTGKAKGRFSKMKLADVNRNKEYSPVSLFKKIAFKDCTPKGLKQLEKDIELFYEREEANKDASL